MKIIDRNGTILKIGDRVKDRHGDTWHLINLGGVSMIAKYGGMMNTILKTVVLKKVNWEYFEKEG